MIGKENMCQESEANTEPSHLLLRSKLAPPVGSGTDHTWLNRTQTKSIFRQQFRQNK